MRVQQILDLVDSGDIALPEFQRGYVWNREQVRGLFSSLYRGYPIGAFMTWNTKADGAAARGGPVAVDGTVKLLLDGQQRVTTLYGVMRGKAPKFFEGSSSTFSGLHFDLEDQSFEFYAPSKMKGNAAWISVTDLMSQGIGPFIARAQQLSEQGGTSLADYINRLNRITQISAIEVHIEEVTGADKTLDVVVDIFNRVNSGGTKLSKGDLALAKICASWPEARHQMNEALDSWSKAGYNFRLEWLLRNVNAEVTGEALFAALADVETARIKAGLTETIKRVSNLLDIVAGRLGLDHDRVLFGRYAFPVMTRYLHHHNGKIPSAAERDKLLYWYLHAGMWGRFAGSTETVLNQDLAAVDGGGIDALIDNMRQMRGGDLTVRPADFSGYSLGARFYPVLYLLTRTLGAQDFGSGVPLSAHMLGHLTTAGPPHLPQGEAVRGRLQAGRRQRCRQLLLPDAEHQYRNQRHRPRSVSGGDRAEETWRPGESVGSRRPFAMADRPVHGLPRGPARIAGGSGERLPQLPSVWVGRPVDGDGRRRIGACRNRARVRPPDRGSRRAHRVAHGPGLRQA